MKIKEVCRRTGLTEKSVRYYVEQGLCSPAQVEVRGRIYSEFGSENLRELTQVIRLRSAGLSIEQISRIKAGELDYDEVIAKYPMFKDEIDEILGR